MARKWPKSPVQNVRANSALAGSLAFQWPAAPKSGGGGGGTLSPAAAAFTVGAASGTLIAAITGLAAGETIDAVVPNDGRLALDGTRRNLLVGLSAATAGAIAATLTTSAGRTLNTALTVNASGSSPVTLVALFPNSGAGTTNQWSMDAGEVENTRIIRLNRRTPGSTVTITPNDGRLKIEDDGTNAWIVCGATASAIGTPTYTISETHPQATNAGDKIDNSFLLNVVAQSNAKAVRDLGFKNAAINGQVHNASNSSTSTSTSTSTSGRNAFCGVKVFKLARQTYEQLRFAFSFYRINPTTNLGEVIGQGFTMPAGCMSWELVGAPTPIAPVLFGGVEEHTFTTGVDFDFCDSPTPAQFGLTEFEDSAEVRFKLDMDVPDGIAIYGCGATDVGMQSIWYNAANRPAGFRDQARQPGYFTGLPSGSLPLGSGFFPTILVGKPKNGAPHPAPMLGILDSIGDRLSDGGPLNVGYFRRAGRKAGTPFFAHSVGGRQIAHWCENNYRSRKLMWFHDVLFDGVDTNDINSGRTLTQITTDHAIVRAQAVAHGMTKFAKVNTPPRVDTGAAPNGSGQHARTLYRATDLVHQFPTYTGARDAAGVLTGLGFEPGGTRDQLNALLAAKVGQPLGYDFLLDMAGICQDPTETSKWKVDPFSALLTTAYVPGQFTLVMDTAPAVGKTLILAPGASEIDPPDDLANGGKNYGFTVRSVSGSAPFTVVIAENNPIPGMLQLGNTPELAHPVGTVVRATNSPDEIHPGSPPHVTAGDNLANWLIGLWAAYTFANTEASSYFARHDSPPSDKFKKATDNLASAYKTAGIFAKYDAQYLLNAPSLVGAQQNLKANAYNLTLSATAPVHTPKKGLKGNGISAKAGTGINPSTGTGLNFVEDSAHVSMWVLQDTTLANVNDVGSANSRVRIKSGAGVASQGRISVNTGVVAATTGTASNPRRVTIVRTAAGTQKLFVNGVLDTTSAVASNGLPTLIELLSDGGATYSDAQLALVTIGGGLTDAEVAAAYNAERTFLQTMGIAA